MEGNDSFTHTEKFKKRQNPSRARDSHIAIIPIDVHHILRILDFGQKRFSYSVSSRCLVTCKSAKKWYLMRMCIS